MIQTTTEDAQRLAHAAILGQLAEGVIVTDASGRITFVNDAAASIHGVARLDVEPTAYSDTYRLFTEDGRPYAPLDLPLARAVRGETVRDARWRIRRPDATEVLAIGTAQPLRDSHDRQIGAVLTLRDDTRREAAERSLRASETALRDLSATLAERVGERTREAKAAQAEAEAASRAKSDFLAAMSHEIRTPLTGILGYTDLLLDEADVAAPVRRCGERIRSAGAALLTIVNDILDFSKVESGHVDLTNEPFSPRVLVDEAVGIVRASADAKRLALRVVADADLPAFVVGDIARLRQILLNLLNNAVKFTRDGEVVLLVRASSLDSAATEPSKALVSFAVRDTGIGIEASKRSLLFERFSQVDSTIQREFGGTGLGLAISKTLIERMGGTIGVDSEPGRGSTFWITLALPLATSLPAVAPSPVPSASDGRYLLLVEDVLVNQELARAVLERGGHRVDVASSGAEAIVAVQAQDYDLVLMDIQMPGLDGMTTTRLIRCLDHRAATVPIVAMTANVLRHQMPAFAEAGMQGHIGKPFRREELFAEVAQWARRPAANDAPVAIRRATIDALADSVGRDTIDRLLGAIAKELTSRFGADGDLPDRESLARDAHALRPAASMLGFEALAALCREAEEGTDNNYPRIVAGLHALRRETIATIETLVAA